ncbi:MAG: hypothetical protein QOF01_3863, partial [Thermomicrobiales bacterium]|nr:hypothetical protein [Thermomicrobiales bacterium]
ELLLRDDVDLFVPGRTSVLQGVVIVPFLRRSATPKSHAPIIDAIGWDGGINDGPVGRGPIRADAEGRDRDPGMPVRA